MTDKPNDTKFPKCYSWKSQEAFSVVTWAPYRDYPVQEMQQHLGDSVCFMHDGRGCGTNAFGYFWTDSRILGCSKQLSKRGIHWASDASTYKINHSLQTRSSFFHSISNAHPRVKRSSDKEAIINCVPIITQCNSSRCNETLQWRMRVKPWEERREGRGSLKSKSPSRNIFVLVHSSAARRIANPF